MTFAQNQRVSELFFQPETTLATYQSYDNLVSFNLMSYDRTTKALQPTEKSHCRTSYSIKHPVAYVGQPKVTIGRDIVTTSLRKDRQFTEAIGSIQLTKADVKPHLPLALVDYGGNEVPLSCDNLSDWDFCFDGSQYRWSMVDERPGFKLVELGSNELIAEFKYNDFHDVRWGSRQVGTLDIFNCSDKESSRMIEMIIITAYAAIAHEGAAGSKYSSRAGLYSMHLATSILDLVATSTTPRMWG